MTDQYLIIKQVPRPENHKRLYGKYYLVHCKQCKNEKIIRSDMLHSGCKDCQSGIINVGDKFGKRVVVAGETRGNKRYWLVRCECGSEKWICTNSLHNTTCCKDCCNLSKLSTYSDEWIINECAKRPIKNIATEIGVSSSKLAERAKLLGVKLKGSAWGIKHNFKIGQIVNGRKIVYLLTKKAPNNSLRRYTRVKCLDCGRESSLSLCDLAKGKKCVHKPTAESNTNWTGYGEISGEFFSSIRGGAKNRNLEFNITIKDCWELYLSQNRKCALTGLPIGFGDKTKKVEKTASLDRIDSSKGYALGNIQWVHKTIQRMKWSYTQEYFLQMCKLVTNTTWNKMLVKDWPSRGERITYPGIYTYEQACITDA